MHPLLPVGWVPSRGQGGCPWRVLAHIHAGDRRPERPVVPIVSEMLDDRNRELAEIARADDFIVSDRLVSLMMCQVSENKEYAAVFEELIDPEGSELYLKPADEYVEPGLPLSFYTLVEAARRRRDRGRLPRKGRGRRPAGILRRSSEPGQVPADNDGRRRQDHRAGRVLAPTRSQGVTDTQRAVDGPN